MKTTALTLLACVMASSIFSGETTEGAKTTQKWCAECHDISGTTTSDTVPEWRHIANDLQRTPKTLCNFLIVRTAKYRKSP